MSKKYPRTYYLPDSPSATKNDRKLDTYDYFLDTPVVITEKMDGSNVAMTNEHLFARSHNGPPSHPSFSRLKALHASMRRQIPINYTLYGEWCEAVHTVRYEDIDQDRLFLFNSNYSARRNPIADDEGWGGFVGDVWESWGELENWGRKLGIKTVPLLHRGRFSSSEDLIETIESLMEEPSAFGKEREGIVVRKVSSFDHGRFPRSVAKWVHSGFISKNQEHWTRGKYERQGR